MKHTHVTLNHSKEFVNKKSVACTKPGKSFHLQNTKGFSAVIIDVGKTSKTNIPESQNLYCRIYFEKMST